MDDLFNKGQIIKDVFDEEVWDSDMQKQKSLIDSLNMRTYADKPSVNINSKANQTQSIDTEEVRYADWIYDDRFEIYAHRYKCSYCDFPHPIFVKYPLFVKFLECCPHCASKMRVCHE